jgi:hypothetical protein
MAVGWIVLYTWVRDSQAFVFLMCFNVSVFDFYNLLLFDVLIVLYIFYFYFLSC